MLKNLGKLLQLKFARHSKFYAFKRHVLSFWTKKLSSGILGETQSWLNKLDERLVKFTHLYRLELAWRVHRFSIAKLLKCYGVNR